MPRHNWFIALSVLTISLPLNVVSPAVAVKGGTVEGHDCSGSPPQAVMKLPLPLSKWGQVACTPFGHVLASHEGWLWIMPDGKDTVLIPSQVVDKNPKIVGNTSYFTKIDVVQVKGEEFNQAYGAFHVGFDEKEVKPDAYRVEITSVSGEKLHMFFFDYDTYAWGMSCDDEKCDADTRFMILDKNHRPEPRQPSI